MSDFEKMMQVCMGEINIGAVNAQILQDLFWAGVVSERRTVHRTVKTFAVFMMILWFPKDCYIQCMVLGTI